MRRIKLVCIAYLTMLLLDSPISFAAKDLNWTNTAVDTGKEQTNFILTFFSLDSFTKFFMAMWVIVLTFLFSKLLSGKIVSYIEKNATEESSREELTGMISRVVSITVLTIGFTISLGILWIDMWIFMWGIWFGIWFTLKTFLTNFVAGIMMVTQWFYHNWDVIEIENQMWKIVKVNALFTAVEQFNGVVFYVPNIKFIENKVTNYYTNDKRRGEIDVLIDYKSDIHKAKQTVVMILDQFPNLLKAPASDVMVDKLWDNWILLKARYWVSVKDDYFETRSNITETINMALKKQGISIAYPHLTVTHTNLEKNSL